MAPSKVNVVEFDKFYNIVNGEKRSAKDYTHGINPSTKKELWPVPVATQADVDEAVKAANKAFKSWKLTSWESRVELWNKFKELFYQYEKEFRDLLAKEAGKPVSLSCCASDCVVGFPVDAC